MHEAKTHEDNCFITLTYDEENLPHDRSLKLSHWQNFMKRLRHHAAKPGIKFFHCGEYGEENKRPHYHALIFGHDFPDRKLWKVRDDITVDSSNILDDLWGFGFTTVGNVTWESAAYCARYALKKINGNLRYKIDLTTGLSHYERIDPYSLEIYEVLPEYSTQSRKPGIGQAFFQTYQDDIYPWDEVIINGHAQRPPRYYDNLFEQTEPEVMETIRDLRTKNMEKYASDNTRARLATKEKVKKAQISQLKRNEEMKNEAVHF